MAKSLTAEPAHSSACALGDQTTELARHTQTRERRAHHLASALGGAIINDCENPEAAAIGELVQNNIEALRSFGRKGTSPRADRSFAAATAAHRQFLRAIKPEELSFRPILSNGEGFPNQLCFASYVDIR